ncbi:UDP-N-acetylmuramoyl-L-alanyl-D-glutamate--2,6-diaminopimelate ligase [bacterium]|nr:MAG: UDP-N-acetylmuramoyl-L-alanyl-D-glutamate--2,6-diaminopimelate ligase [bacterium]
MKFFIKKLIPAPLLRLYHFIVAILAAFLYGFPSNKMIVIGVTGTGGKSTTIKMIGEILTEYGLSVGWLSSLSIRILDKEKINPYHMTMLGRFKLQKHLKIMLSKGVHYVVVEVTSEGIKQFRHIEINFDILVFTNLSREHIEAHGSFEKYRDAKLKIFKKLFSQKRKKLAWLEKKQEKIIIANLDDENVDYFIEQKADKKYGFSVKEINALPKKIKLLKIISYKLNENGSTFTLDSTKFDLKLLGEFNIYNALAAITTARALGIDYITAKHALLKIEEVPGRMEKIETGKNFSVIIDLAHTPDSLEQAYEALRKAYFLVPGFKNMICVLGSAGGGRDKWKRPVMGKIAGEFCDKIYLTNEDPYDEIPKDILKDIEKGVKKENKVLGKEYFKIEDRRKAISEALKSAKKEDLVVITGKGTEATMVIGNKKIPWDEKKVVEEELKKL